MRQERKRPRGLPWPPRPASLKGNNHRNPALRWSLFILIMELRKHGLEPLRLASAVHIASLESRTAAPPPLALTAPLFQTQHHLNITAPPSYPVTPSPVPASPRDRASLFPPLPLSLTAAPSSAPPISDSNLLKPPHLSCTAAYVSNSSHLKALPQVDAYNWGIE
uniref:Uncharacterized protein n=1 Tax=Fagus sylvatica TaxID=28930 RepID=A0A2N9EDS2_FAGSY